MIILEHVENQTVLYFFYYNLFIFNDAVAEHAHTIAHSF